MQMPAIFARRTVVVSGGASWANELGAPMRPATPADESVARKRRRFCVDCITWLLSRDISITSFDHLVGAAEQRDKLAPLNVGHGPTSCRGVTTSNRRTLLYAQPSTTLADLLTPLLAANPSSTMRASLRR